MLIGVHNGAVKDANCYSVGTHFDPYGVGDTVVCNPAEPSKCQVHPNPPLRPSYANPPRAAFPTVTARCLLLVDGINTQ